MTLGADGALIDLAATIGELPGGDIPVAWYASMDQGVIDAYLDYQDDQRKWNDRYAKMLKKGKLSPTSQFLTEGAKGHLLGVCAPKTMNTPPRWWRWEKGQILVPRRRTTAERNSEVAKLFDKLAQVPRAIDYVPGMPHTLIIGERAYAPQIRRPAKAVLAFLAANPEQASPPFEPDGRWAKMKISAFHLLKERQMAAAAVR